MKPTFIYVLYWIILYCVVLICRRSVDQLVTLTQSWNSRLVVIERASLCSWCEYSTYLKTMSISWEIPRLRFFFIHPVYIFYVYRLTCCTHMNIYIKCLYPLWVSLSCHCFGICTWQTREFPGRISKCTEQMPTDHQRCMAFLYRTFDDLMYTWKFRCVELKIMTNNENN